MALAPFSRGPGRVGLAGADVCEPEFHLPESGRSGSIARRRRPFELRIAVPSDFETARGQRSDRPVVRGDFNPIFQGTYSSRIELKQKTREVERHPDVGREIGRHAAMAGPACRRNDRRNAWEPALFNQAHDLMSGVMTDHVYDRHVARVRLFAAPGTG